MIPTPEQVVPLVLPAVEPLRKSLRRGIGFADNLQPDPFGRDRHFWAHSARFFTRQNLMGIEHPEGWALVPNVPNSGIHLTLGGLHQVRVVRSLGGTTPPPGPNWERQKAWQGVKLQGTLNLTGDDTLPLLSLVFDWQDSQGEPEIHVGLPIGSWGYQRRERLHWRIPLPEGGVDLNALRFDPSTDGSGTGERLVELVVDEPEIGSEDG